MISNIISFIIYPIFQILICIAKEKDALSKDEIAWCKWKQVKRSKWNFCKLFVTNKSLRNLIYYRVGSFSFPLRIILPGYDHLQITMKHGTIQGGLVIQHGFSTIISAAKIGNNCKIYQQVTIGYNHKLEAPIIEDNVEICCGAKIIGGCHIGSNVIIGANAVVVNDIPSNCIVAGVPAKIIKQL